MVKIRRAKFGDERGIHETHRKSILELCSSDYTPEQIQVWAGAEYSEGNRRHTIMNSWVWVAEDEGLIKGVGVLSKTWVDNRDEGQIRLLYFAPEITRKGHARELIKEMEAHARCLGWNQIFLESTITAKPFYEACGYRETGPLNHFNWSGVEIPYHPMKKILT